MAFYCSTCQFICDQYSMVFSNAIRSSVHAASKNFNVNCEPFSTSIVDGIQKFKIQQSRSNVVTVEAVVRLVHIDCTNFEYRSVISTMNWLQDFVFGNRPSIFIATYFSGMEGKKKRRFCCLLLVRQV